eukprot:CAMPEP_0198495662 /NCGR_PEP_ID=MMETSP1462-20131121/5335_1 /TAXON_ID=1333877 /ORGANISM="Brandtodinium nutriculum, Strain RCC3387" /LENGTH=494 /DNA_ID=CAMNT_0044224455 /DNA_START=166 /DNA_END=1650 /DNA_ORIENTATION=+
MFKRLHLPPPTQIAEASTEDAIDQVGLGVFHGYIYIIVGLFIAADSVQVGFIAFVAEVLKEEWGCSESTKAMMECMIFVGLVLGSPTWGWLADRYGRRPIMLASALWVCLFGALTAACNSLEQLMPCQFAVGFGCAGMVVAFDVLEELLPSNTRGPVTCSTFYWFAAGTLYSNICAKYVLCSAGWRAYAVACSLPTLVVTFLGWLLVPESAHWLVAERRNEEAAQVLSNIANTNGRPLCYGRLIMPEVLETLATKDLCVRSKLRTPLILMMLIGFCWGLTYFSILLLLPHIFSEKVESAERDQLGSTAAMPTALSVRDCYGLTFNFKDIMVCLICQNIGLTAAVLGINCIGRVKTQVWLYLVAAAFVVGLGFPDVDHTVLTVFASVALASVSGGCSVTFAHTPELFPTQARVLAMGMCNACARFGAALAPYIISNLIAPLPTALIVSAVSLTAAFSASRVRETMGARIEDDHHILSGDDESKTDVAQTSFVCSK